jgi:hypothetical protein
VFNAKLALVTSLPRKSLVSFNLGVLACNEVISLAAVANPVLIIVKLSRKPWVSLSTPATGYVQSIVPLIILLAMLIPL